MCKILPKLPPNRDQLMQAVYRLQRLPDEYDEELCRILYGKPPEAELTKLRSEEAPPVMLDAPPPDENILAYVWYQTRIQADRKLAAAAFLADLYSFHVPLTQKWLADHLRVPAKKLPDDALAWTHPQGCVRYYPDLSRFVGIVSGVQFPLKTVGDMRSFMLLPK